MQETEMQIGGMKGGNQQDRQRDNGLAGNKRDKAQRTGQRTGPVASSIPGWYQ